MRKVNSKKIILAIALMVVVLPLATAAQPFRAQYQDYEGVPKSLRRVLETGSNYDSGYATQSPSSFKPQEVEYLGQPKGQIVVQEKVNSGRVTTHSVNSDAPSRYSNYLYSEAEAKNAKKLGVHALSADAVQGAAPTLPVESISVDREAETSQKEGKEYILGSDGSKYELRGGRVNIYDGMILPEGYQVEKKPVKIPTYQLKGLYKEKGSSGVDVKKKSSEQLKINFLENQYNIEVDSSFLPYKIAAAGDGIYFPASAKTKRPANQKVSLGGGEKSPEDTTHRLSKRPANIIFNYTDQADYMSGNALGGAGHENTMESLLASAYSKNPEINSSREALKAADESMPQAFAGYLPELRASLSNAYNKSGGSTGSKKKFYPDSQSLNLSQGIFGGGETYFAVEVAKNRILAARNELRATEQNFLLEAINTYIDLIFTKKVLILAENNETILNEQLKASKERFVIGDATRTDVAQSEARLANAVSNRVLANGDYTNAKSDFRRIFQVEPPESLPMPTALPDIPETFEEVMSAAVSGNPELNRAKHLMDVRDSEIDVRKSQLYPQLDLNGAISRRDGVSGSSLIETESESITLNLTVPIYSQGTTYSRIREAQDRRNQSKFDYQNALNVVRNQLIQAWQSLTTTASNIEATKASLVASEYALEGVREEQKEGARTILDVLDAEQEHFQSEISHARAIKDSVIAVYRLKSVLGQLSPKNLSLPIKDYDPELHYNDTKNKFIGF